MKTCFFRFLLYHLLLAVSNLWGVYSLEMKWKLDFYEFPLSLYHKIDGLIDHFRVDQFYIHTQNCFLFNVTMLEESCAGSRSLFGSGRMIGSEAFCIYLIREICMVMWYVLVHLDCISWWRG